jgi:hypothetical protein
LYAWKTALLLLSLDKVKPLWEEFELKFKQPERVRDRIRLYITDQHKLDKLNEDQWHVDIESSLISQLLTDVHEIEGDFGLTALREWIEGKYIVCEFEEPWRWMGWRTLLFRLSQAGGQGLLLQKIPQEKVDALLDIANAWSESRDQINARLEEMENQPITEWDKKQYEYYRRDQYPDVSPIDHLSKYLKCQMFDKFWDRVLLLLTPQEMEMLNRWGLVEAMVAGISPVDAEIPKEYRIPHE